MKNNLEQILQLALGLAIGAAGLGAFLAVALPWWLANISGLIFLAVFALAVSACFIVGLLLCGMWLQRQEHNGHIRGLLKQALGSYF